MSQPAQNTAASEAAQRVTVEDFIKLLRLKPESEKTFRAGMKMSSIDGAPPVTLVLKFGKSAPECLLGFGRAEVRFV